MITKIFDRPGKFFKGGRDSSAASQAQADLQLLLQDREIVMDVLDFYSLNIDDIASVYLEKESRYCMLKTSERQPDGLYGELPLDHLHSWLDWFYRDATIDRTIDALGFVKVVNLDDEPLGLHPRKFEILPKDPDEGYISLCNIKTGVCVKVQGLMKYIESDFEVARRAMDQGDAAAKLDPAKMYQLPTVSEP